MRQPFKLTRAFCDELRAAELAPGFNQVLLPGEIAQRRTQRRLAEGVDLTYRE